MTTVPTGQPVLVRLDKGKINAIWGSILAMHVAIAAVIVVAAVYVVHSLDATLFAVAPLGLLLFLQVFQISVTLTVWSGLSRHDVPLEIDPQGLVMRSAQGEVRASWDAVAAATLERHLVGRRLRIRLVPQQDPRSVGIAHQLRGRSARILRRDGMQYALRILRTDAQTLARAFAEQSGGRVTIR